MLTGYAGNLTFKILAAHPGIRSEKEGSSPMTSKEVLEELHWYDGQITDFGRPVGQIFFVPAPGNTRTGERIESETFSRLRDEGWIATEDEGRIKRYRVSESGFAHLNDAGMQNEMRAGSN
jgi:hypothetical protein